MDSDFAMHVDRSGTLSRPVDLSVAVGLDSRRRTGTPRIQGHELVVRSLTARGITHVYAVAGSPTDGTIGRCARAGLRTIGARHQQAAVMMAAAHNYCVGGLVAVALVSSGVAVTNAATGIHVAQENGWPVLLLAGAAEAVEGLTPFMGLDGVRFLSGLCKASARVESTAAIPVAVSRAWLAASTARAGAAYVELPQDVLEGFAAAPEPADVPGNHNHLESTPDNTAIARAAYLLSTARRPLVIVGKGARWDDAYVLVRELVEELSIPFVASPMGRGLIADDHPLGRTAHQSEMLCRADVVLLVGARLNWTFRHGAELRSDARIIQIDPEPTAFTEGRPRHIALSGTAREILPRLLAEIRGTGPPQSRHDWPPEFSALTESATAYAAPRVAPTPDAIAAAIATAIPPEAITVLDGNVVMLAAQRRILVREPVSRLTPGTSGCMGTGLPFAIGAALACPQRPIVLVTGDMALGLNFFEFETAVRHRIPVIAVLANNDGPSGARRENGAQLSDYGERVLAYQPGIRYDLMASKLGVHAEFVEEIRSLPEALARARATGLPALLQIPCDALAD